MMRKIIFYILLSVPLCLRAQGNLPLLQIPVLELLQYQVQKGKRTVAPYLFSKYGLKQIPAELVVDGSRQLWGWHVSPNTDFDPSKQPFYRLFAKKDNSSIVIIDDRGGTLQIVFWDKRYYRTFAADLQSHGYQLQPVKPANNVLRFQRVGSSLVADVTVWADMYVLELHS